MPLGGCQTACHGVLNAPLPSHACPVPMPPLTCLPCLLSALTLAVLQTCCLWPVPSPPAAFLQPPLQAVDPLDPLVQQLVQDKSFLTAVQTSQLHAAATAAVRLLRVSTLHGRREGRAVGLQWAAGWAAVHWSSGSASAHAYVHMRRAWQASNVPACHPAGALFDGKRRVQAATRPAAGRLHR